jgi:hypothetical protein
MVTLGISHSHAGAWCKRQRLTALKNLEITMTTACQC